jgi:hypothetical protein
MTALRSKERRRNKFVDDDRRRVAARPGELDLLGGLARGEHGDGTPACAVDGAPRVRVRPHRAAAAFTYTHSCIGDDARGLVGLAVADGVQSHRPPGTTSSASIASASACATSSAPASTSSAAPLSGIVMPDAMRPFSA